LYITNGLTPAGEVGIGMPEMICWTLGSGALEGGCKAATTKNGETASVVTALAAPRWVRIPSGPVRVIGLSVAASPKAGNSSATDFTTGGHGGP